VTAVAPRSPDIDRSLARQASARALPAGVRALFGLGLAALLLWPLVPLINEAATRDAWSRAVFEAAWSSIWQAVLAATAGVALSVPLGWALARLAVPARRLVRALLTLPIVTPGLAVALGAAWLLGPSWPLLVVANAGFGLAIGVRLGGAAWLALDPRETETARTLGLPFVQLVRWHYVPALRRAFAASWVLAFALALSAVASAYVLAPPSRLALPELALGTSGAAIGTTSSAAASLLLAAIAVIALAVFVRLRPAQHGTLGAVGFQPAGSLAIRDRVLLGLAFLLAAMVTVGPLLALGHGAFTLGAAEQVTGANVSAVFADARPFELEPAAALRYSLLVAVGALAIALPLGFVGAMLVAPLRGWMATAVEAALLLPLCIPVVLASGLRVAERDGAFALLLVHAAMGSALMVRLMLPSARARVGGQFEAAALLGASRWTSWKRLIAASLRGRLAVGAALVLCWSIGELGAALILQRADAAPASVAIAFALQRRTATADGLAFALSGLFFLFVSIVFVTIEYRRTREITEF